jgi:hypothetical protein
LPFLSLPSFRIAFPHRPFPYLAFP